MKLYILDGESYYDREYNLERLDPASYILDPRFELIGIAVKEPGTEAYWVEGPDAPAFFGRLDPNDIMTVSHNALFDNCIWSYRYGFVPRLMVDTVGVARAVLSLKSNSLESVAEYWDWAQRVRRSIRRPACWLISRRILISIGRM